MFSRNVTQFSNQSPSQLTMTHHILIIDSQVDDYQQLVAGAKPEFDVFVLDAHRNGIEQITQILDASLLTPHASLSLHIVSHGSPGTLYLGNSQLSLDTLERYAEQLQSWFTPHPSPLTPHALYLYGCNVAAGDAGEEFIQQLQDLIHVEISASTKAVGYQNWQLDVPTKTNVDLAFTSTVTATYTSVFSVDEGFETGNFNQLPWVFSGNQGWTITGNSASGTFAATSGDIGDTQSSTMSVTLNVLAGNISFAWGVSSETGWDYLRFYIDGVQQSAIDGNRGYQTVSFPVSAGSHIFTWSYTKDGSVSTGSDSGFVDNIDFPLPNVAPTITSANAVNVEENSTGVVLDVNATDAEGNPISYSITGGADAAQFSINNSTGELSFVSSPNYEDPSDSNDDNIYEVQVTANDGNGGTTAQTINVTVTNVNEAPIISGDGNADEVLILAAEANSLWIADVESKLETNGFFDVVDVFNVSSGTPTLAQLQNYDSVLVFSNFSGFQNPTQLGDTLADYVDAGGGVVLNTFAFNIPLAGRWSSGGYSPIQIAGQSQGTPLTLGTIFDPNHPILDGVTIFSGGSSSYHNTGDANPNATVVANWSNGRPLIVDLQTFNAGIVGLNFFAPSSDVSSDFWTASTDGDLLMGNALEYVGNAGGPIDESATEDAAAFTVDLLAGASDEDGDVLNVTNLTLTDGDDAGVTIDGNSLDIDANVYNSLAEGESEVITYSYDISDGNGGTVAQTATITINGVNDVPEITSSNTAEVEENSTAVTTVVVTDAEGDPISYSITGGADAAQFSIDSSTGELSFVSSPNYEDPSDSNDDNIYEVQVTANDGNGGTIAQTINVTVTNVNDAPVIGGGDVDEVLILAAEANSSWVADVESKLEITGFFDVVDVFNIYNSGTPTLAQLQNYDSVLLFSNYPIQSPTELGNILADYVDAGGGVVLNTFAFVGDIYSLGGRWSSGGYSPIQIGGNGFGTPLTLGTIFDPIHPILDGVTSFSGGSSSYHNTVGDANPNATVVANWSNGRPLIVDLQTFNAGIVGLNFFAPSSDVSSDFWTASTDGDLLMGNALEYVGNAGGPIDESATEDAAAFTVDLLAGAFDEDGDVLNVINLTLTNGDDAGVTVNGNSLDIDPSAYNSLAEGESEVITYSYDISDGNGGTVAQTATITINGVNDVPEITSSNTAEVEENSTAVTTVVVTDADGDPISYSITGGVDATQFSINNSTGELSFVGSPNYEDPSDSNDDNIYEVQVTANDGNGGTIAQTINVTVTDVNEAPVISGGSVGYWTGGQSGTTANDGKTDWKTAGNSLNILLNWVAGVTPAGGNVLLVSDTQGLVGVEGFISAEGYTVTSVTEEFGAGSPNLTNLSFLQGFDFVIWDESGSGSGDIQDAAVYSTLEAYIQSGGDLLVTGYDTLASPTDTALANLVRSTTTVDTTSQDIFTAQNIEHFALNGPYGDFRNVVIDPTYSDWDGATADTSAGAISLATFNGYDAIVYTNLGASAAALTENDAVSTLNLLAGVVDPDGDTLSVTNLTLTNGDDAGVTINGNSLEIDPSVYNALGTGESEVITYSYDISDGNGGTLARTTTITINGVNDVPVFTSSAPPTLAENSTVATTVVATDADGDPISYSISGGVDAALFQVDATTGELSFITAPDFEHPGDNNDDNVYEVTVSASDGSEATTQTLSVSVVDLSNGVTDFNNDNQPDVVWRRPSTGQTNIWFTDGQNKIGGGPAGATIENPNWLTVGVGDFDKDGKRDDILWRNVSSGANVIWFMDGINKVGNATLDPIGTNWEVQGVGDFEHQDYTDDILWRNQSTGQTVVWTMDGTTKTGTINFGTLGTAWKAQGVGDFEANNFVDDIVWRNYTTGQTIVWETDGQQKTGSFALDTVGTNWKIDGVGDLDGDKIVDDLLWYNTSNNAVVTWFIDNGAKVTSSTIGAPSNGWDAVL